MKDRTLKQLGLKSVTHLALQVGYPSDRLIYISKNVCNYYRSGDRVIGGKTRHIDEPVSGLRIILDRLKFVLDRIELPDYLHGGRKGCSVITNAAIHIGQAAVLNFDIQDFFPSIHYTRVYRLFAGLGCSPDIASILTRLTTYGGCVPHGSPTSTVVANLCIVPLAKRIKALATKHSSQFTQFVDDGIVSGPAYLEKLRKLIDRIIKQEGFTSSPKPHKRQTKYRHEEQVVTGVKVNYCIDVPVEKYDRITAEIQTIRSEISKGMTPDKKTIASVQGRINYVAMLNPKKGSRLNRQFQCVYAA
ncbi:MAG: reverse transcriptase family protein [Acetivibrionales bacterium]|jgi:RNA-directed DNA polymerase